MSKTTVTTIACDVCKSKSVATEDGIEIQVIFETNQTDGYPSKPYLSRQKLDLCAACLKEVYSGHYIFAHGAQGYNSYYFREKTE